MDLTPKLLMDFFEQARTHVKKRLPERRRAGRLSLAATAYILPLSDQSPTDVLICNLSNRGVGMVVPKPLSVGVEFALRLGTAEPPFNWIRCLTTRWHPSPNGSCQIGAKFCDMTCTDSGEMPHLIDPAGPMTAETNAMKRLVTRLAAFNGPSAAPRQAGKESRVAKRVPIRYFSGAVVIAGNSEAKHIRIMVRDISTRGIGFLSTSAPPIDARVALTLSFSDCHAKAILARVVRCQKLNTSHFVVGAELLTSVKQHPSHKAIPDQWLRRPGRSPSHL